MDPRVYNKAHAAVYALMHYQHMKLLTAIRKDTIMGLTEQELAEREATKKAQEVEQKLDKNAAEQDAQRDTEV
jgi:hypothetical protein